MRLADVLTAAGVHREDGLHVEFLAPDVAQEARPVQSYGSSIPLSKAMSEEVLLAWQMNGQPLPRAHGGPVRVVVPGYIGARSVKWVTAITVQPVPSQNYFQALDYRILPPEADADSVVAGEGISLSSCRSTATSSRPPTATSYRRCAHHPRLGDRRRRPTASGVSTCPSTAATPGSQADLHPAPSRWAWRPWSLTVDVAPGPLSITARAWADTGITQPESPASLWNPRGYGNNAYAHIELNIV